MIAKLAGAFAVWLLCLVVVIPLLLAAAVMALSDMAVEARRKQREKKRVNREIREFERDMAMGGGEK